METPRKEDIEQATKRVKIRLPIDEVRDIPKFRNISEEKYHQLIKNAETFALLILEVILKGKDDVF